MDVVLGNGLLLAFAMAMCSTVGLIAWVRWGRGPHKPMPPGPVGLPIIGYLNNLGHLPHQTLARLSKIHGPLMCLRLGAVPVVVASSPAMAKHILHTHDKSFAGRPQHLSAPHIINGRAPNIAFSLPGPYWKLMRQICTTNLFSNKQLERFRPVRVLEIATLLRCVFAAQGSPLPLRHMLQTFSSNSVSRMALGKPLHELVSTEANSLNLVSILSEILKLLGSFNIGDYIPFLGWMDLQGFGRQSKGVARKVHSVLQTVVDRRRLDENDATGHPRDFLDLLLMASVDPKYKHLQIGDDSVRAMLLEMYVAGSDTSAVTMEWALAELLANPEKLRHAQEELDEKVGTSRIVQEMDIPNLPYLRAIVNETMRLHAPGPLLIPHMSLEACQIEGYHIPANTDVYINAWAIHRDPSVWASPLEFHPERFLEGTLQDVTPGQNFNFLPFGAGRRGCLGWKLGILNVQIVLANLLHAFDWTTVVAGKPPLSEEFGLAVALEYPLVAIPMPRLPKSLYNIAL